MIQDPDDARQDPRRDPYPDLPPLELGVVIPDDARALEHEAEALRRERLAQQRRSHWESGLKTRRWQRYGLSGPLLVIVLVVVGVVGSLLTLLAPSRPVRRAQAPLPTSVPVPDGNAGGLLPDVTLRVQGQQMRAQAYRPAVFALLPPGCTCPGLVREILQQSQEFGLRLLLVGAGPGAAETEAAALARQSGGIALPVVDLENRLAPTFRASGMTLLVVRNNGIVDNVVRDVRLGQRLEPQLRRATLTGTAPVMGPARQATADSDRRRVEPPEPQPEPAAAR